MKRAIIAGVIAGFLAGIVTIILNVSGLFDLFSVTAHNPPVSFQIMAKLEIITGIVWGIIWSIFYVILYDHIPAKGIKKGIAYGFIIWIIVIVRFALIDAAYGGPMWATPWAIAGFFSTCIVYVSQIGILYKKE